MQMILYFVGAVIIYTALKSMVDAGKTLPIEFIERQKSEKMLSPFMFGVYTAPYIVAYLLYEQFPQWAWKIIFLVFVFAAVESAWWYYGTIKKLQNGGFPASYVKKMRRAYGLFGLGAVVLAGSGVPALFK